jgi:hypothetical protein
MPVPKRLHTLFNMRSRSPLILIVRVHKVTIAPLSIDDADGICRERYTKSDTKHPELAPMLLQM